MAFTEDYIFVYLFIKIELFRDFSGFHIPSTNKYKCNNLERSFNYDNSVIHFTKWLNPLHSGSVENTSGYQHLHHLVSSLQDLIDSDVTQKLFNWVVFQVTISSMHLQC